MVLLKKGVNYTIEITDKFAVLEVINESNNNSIDKQWENVHNTMIKSAEVTLVFLKDIKINRILTKNA